MNWLSNKNVAVSFTGIKQYPKAPPFHPSEKYPEYRGTETDPSNHIYGWVRTTLHNLGLDTENFGTSDWSPFKDFVKPGMTVFIKPNTVRHYHVEGKDIFSILTHASVVRPVLDYVDIALQGDGRIIIGDSQTLYGHFDEAQDVTYISDLVHWFRSQSSIPVEHFDLRKVRAVRTWLGGRWGREKVEHDPRGYQVVDLGTKSLLEGLDTTRFRTVVSDVKVMHEHHGPGKHQYIFPKSVLSSDVIIGIPKLKTHRRAAVSLTMKSCIGLAAEKGTLAHYQVGSPEEGGDEYIYSSWRKRQFSRLQDKIQATEVVPLQFLYAFARGTFWFSHKVFPFQDNINEAKWHGNNTIWRTLIDCYHISMFADADGKVHDTPQRTHFGLIDGIIAGEKEGPIAADPRYEGVLMAGFDGAAMDAVATGLMGFDVDKIPQIRRALELTDELYPIDGGTRSNINIIVGEKSMNFDEFQEQHNLHFEPHPAFKGYTERE